MKSPFTAPARWLCVTLPTLCVSLIGSAQTAPGTTGSAVALALRAQEIAHCLPGEISTWGDGSDRAAIAPQLVFVYEHSSAPLWFDDAAVLGALDKAASAWSECGIRAQVVRQPDASAGLGDAIRVQWSQSGSRNNFGLADLGQRTLWLGPGAFLMLEKINPQAGRATLQMVISHEMGHFFGLMAHSRRCVDVTSYYNNPQGQSCLIRGGGSLPKGVEYRAALPTACDIARCRALNP